MFLFRNVLISMSNVICCFLLIINKHIEVKCTFTSNGLSRTANRATEAYLCVCRKWIRSIGVCVRSSLTHVQYWHDYQLVHFTIYCFVSCRSLCLSMRLFCECSQISHTVLFGTLGERERERENWSKHPYTAQIEAKTTFNYQHLFIVFSLISSFAIHESRFARLLPRSRLDNNECSWNFYYHIFNAVKKRNFCSSIIRFMCYWNESLAEMVRMFVARWKVWKKVCPKWIIFMRLIGRCLFRRQTECSAMHQNPNFSAVFLI